jgi:hypothetical protein
MSIIIRLARADYCDINLNPVLNVSIYNTTIYTFNLNKIGGGLYNYSFVDNSTNQTINLLLKLECNKTKTFWILTPSTYIETKPNSTIWFNFTIAPVVFTNYTISSWGLFDLSNINLGYLDDVTNIRIDKVMPAIPSGIYYQTFEITNGLQTQYITFTINNTLTLNPIIMRFTYPTRISYGKWYNVSLLASNLKTAKVIVNDREFSLTNTSEYYWEGKFYVTNSTNKIKLIVGNEFGNLEKEYEITVEPLQFSVSNLILPAVPINQTSKIQLVDFGVDLPIPISISSAPIAIGNVSNYTPFYDYYITDENGIINPPQAKSLYILINPKKSERGRISITFSSPYFDSKSLMVEFLGSQQYYSSEMNITYYNKPTYCRLIGSDLLNSKYVCQFEFPYNINPSELQSKEWEMLKEAYESKIQIMNRELNSLKTQRLIAVIGTIITVIVLLIWHFKDKIMLMGWW